MKTTKKRGPGRPRFPGVRQRLELRVPTYLRKALRTEAVVTSRTMNEMAVEILRERYAAHA